MVHIFIYLFYTKSKCNFRHVHIFTFFMCVCVSVYFPPLVPSKKKKKLNCMILISAQNVDPEKRTPQ